MSDWMIRGLVGDDARMIAVNATALAEQTRQLHGLTGDAVRVAAEAIVAALFMSAHIKGEERISFQIQGTKPKCAFIADIDSTGGLRARLTPAVMHLPYFGRMEGMLLVVKSLPGKEMYRGVTEVRAETIESALTRHLGQSAQVDAVLRVGAEINEAGEVEWAGGILLERLPAKNPENSALAAAQFAVRFDPLRTIPVDAILGAFQQGVLEGQAIQRLEERELRWRCSCGQERVEAVLASLGVVELQAMREEDDGAEVVCHFCNVAYAVTGERLQQLLESAT
jgi:molecular chaperone Hsp33